MTKLALLGVLVASLAGGCVPYGYGYGYGPHYHHRYWHHHGYWRRGFWRDGMYVDNYLYVDPEVALPTGVTVPQVQVDAYGNYVGPGITAAPTTAVTAPGTVQPIAPAPQPQPQTSVPPIAPY